MKWPVTPGRRAGAVLRMVTSAGAWGMHAHFEHMQGTLIGVAGWTWNVRSARSLTQAVKALREARTAGRRTVWVLGHEDYEVESAIVLMRLDHFTDLWVAYLQANKDRLFREEG